MISAEKPDNESSRIATLAQYDILDTEAEEAYNEITELAAALCEAPIALISIVDHSRQWFKARTGLEAHETARSVSFCAHAILQPDIFVVNDTTADKRFFDNPLVTGPPYIRFYAGAPLFSKDGHGLGTLCVIDNVPRTLSKHQEKTLSVLRTHLLKLLEARLTTRLLIESNHQLESFSNMIMHDLRTGVRLISGFSDILLDEHGDSMEADAKDIVHRIKKSSSKVGNITDSYLKLANITKTPLALSEINLSGLAREIISELAESEPERVVEVDIEKNINAIGDENLLYILLNNLLSNAWKYTSKKETATIKFYCKANGNKKIFCVSDNGAGFEMAYARDLFTPFKRLHSENDFPGIGIGLAIVQAIVSRHGGSIRAEGQVNQGATFSFTLSESR